MGNRPATQTYGQDFNVRQLNPRQRSRVSLVVEFQVLRSIFWNLSMGILSSADFKLIGYSNDKDFLFK